MCVWGRETHSDTHSDTVPKAGARLGAGSADVVAHARVLAGSVQVGHGARAVGAGEPTRALRICACPGRGGKRRERGNVSERA